MLLGAYERLERIPTNPFQWKVKPRFRKEPGDEYSRFDSDRRSIWLSVKGND